MFSPDEVATKLRYSKLGGEGLEGRSPTRNVGGVGSRDLPPK